MPMIPTVTVHGVPQGSSSIFSVDVYHGEKRIGTVRPKGKLKLHNLSSGDELLFRMQVFEATCKVTTSDIYLNSDSDGNLSATTTDTSLFEDEGEVTVGIQGEEEQANVESGIGKAPTAFRIAETFVGASVLTDVIGQILIAVIILILVVLWLVS